MNMNILGEFTVFSQRFYILKRPTITVTRCLVGSFLKKRVDYSHGFSSVFLRPPEVTKIVLPKVLQNFEKTPKCTWWPKELNQKGSPRNIQYRARPKGPLDFFRHFANFVQKFFSTKGSPFQVFGV